MAVLCIVRNPTNTAWLINSVNSAADCVGGYVSQAAAEYVESGYISTLFAEYFDFDLESFELMIVFFFVTFITGHVVGRVTSKMR